MATKTAAQAQTTILNAFQSARTELHTLVQRGIDLAEKRSKAMFRFARTLTRRLGRTGGARKARKKS